LKGGNNPYSMVNVFMKFKNIFIRLFYKETLSRGYSSNSGGINFWELYSRKYSESRRNQS